MSSTDNKMNQTDGSGARQDLVEGKQDELALDDTLKNLRLSIHAWSDAAYHRPRSAAQRLRHKSWRLAAGWALAALLVVGGLSAGLQERNQREQQARIALAARVIEQRQLARVEAGPTSVEPGKGDDEDLLTKVDRDVSRDVPSALEPLAQLMDNEAK
jgi:hypothetical protein